ncbi:uncharacterized protein LOC62_07G008948 [Vanrija pseudolonga]|uniref:Uncharacterized protein n=1 Tax=Vanrija pseudolonga TaxID=143232 RepID=A0AAF0YJZ3_9TREE|nr:hypothetical protein LOC62_07G008948 [Vanrija pseudolonga]
MLAALTATLALLATATASPLVVPGTEPAVVAREDDYFHVNYYSDGSCQNYIVTGDEADGALGDFDGYLQGPHNYDGDFGGTYAGSFIVVNVGTWAQTLDVNGQTVFDISLCPSDHPPQANQIQTCFPLGMNVGKESIYFGACELFCAECFAPA